MARAATAAVESGVRERMAVHAQRLAAREHDLEHVADLYAAALEEAAGGDAVRDAVLREVSAVAADVGIDAASDEAVALGRALDEVEL
jgi:hypothetical protein